MSVIVREAVPAEYEDIGALTVAAYAVYEEIVGDDGYVRELRDVADRAQSSPIYAALDADGRVIGGAMYVPGPDNPHAEVEREGEAGIRMLAIAPEAQGCGAGRAPVEALMTRARAEGRRGMALLTLDSMTAAHRIYHRAGFTRDPERDWEIEPGLTLRCFEIRFDGFDGADAPTRRDPG